MSDMTDEETDERMGMTIFFAVVFLFIGIILIWIYWPKNVYNISMKMQLNKVDISTEIQVAELMKELEGEK